ncbi:hypothetical protein H4219_004852, partial [Mycoemilia scoparia]
MSESNQQSQEYTDAFEQTSDLVELFVDSNPGIYQGLSENGHNDRWFATHLDHRVGYIAEKLSQICDHIFLPLLENDSNSSVDWDYLDEVTGFIVEELIWASNYVQQRLSNAAPTLIEQAELDEEIDTHVKETPQIKRFLYLSNTENNAGQVDSLNLRIDRSVRELANAGYYSRWSPSRDITAIPIQQLDWKEYYYSMCLSRIILFDILLHTILEKLIDFLAKDLFGNGYR